MKFEKITKVSLPFDRRHAKPSKNYGIHGLDIWFILKGEKGAVQFGVTFPQYLPSVDREYRQKFPDWESRKEIRGFDVGYHAKVPQFDGHKSMGHCDVLGCECFYDGSSLASDAWVEDIFSVTGESPEKRLWERLENEYRERFGDQ